MTVSQIAKYLQEVFNTFTKSELEKEYRPLVSELIKKHADLIDEVHELDIAKYILIAESRTSSKGELAMLASLPFVNASLYEAWKSLLLPGARSLWDTLIFENHLHETEILDRFGIHIAVKKERYWYGETMERVAPGYRIFQVVKSGAWNNPTLTVKLPYELRLLLKNYYSPPEEATLKPLKEIPETEFLYEQGDRTMLAEINRIFLYHEQGQIPVTGKDRPKHTSLGKMQKTLNLREFFDSEEKDNKLRVLRTNMLAALIVHCDKKPETDWLDFITENLLVHSLLNTCETPAVLLTDLKGMGHIDHHYLTPLEPPYFEYLKQLFVVLQEKNSGEWMDFENFYHIARFSLVPMTPISSSLAKDKLYYEFDGIAVEGDFKFRQSKHFIDDKLYQQAIGIPYLKATIFMYAALGIFDIAYDRPDRTSVGQTCYSAYDGLRYFKLTPLGAYFFGIIDSYDVGELLEVSGLNFSPDALTITVGGTDTSISFTLTPYARQIGPNRFATDNQTFLQGIKSKKDLAHKIKMFREVAAVEMPPNWEAFFEDMDKKVDPFEPLKEQMLLYKLPEDNRALIQLIAQDAVLKKTVLKAEGFHILFPKSKLPLFKKRLAEFGYLIT
jgi:hypothetical protein